MLQQQRYEVLFEIGAHAILDRYYREAVSSFTTSRERFYEFGIRVMLAKLQATEPALFAACWEAVSKHSERQLGAFVFLWAASFGECPEILNAYTRLRNDVVHRGKIPTREEALDYGNAVLQATRANLQRLRQSHSTEIRADTTRHLREASADWDVAATGQHPSTMWIRTAIGMGAGASATPVTSLEGYLVALEQERRRLDATLQGAMLKSGPLTQSKGE